MVFFVSLDQKVKTIRLNVLDQKRFLFKDNLTNDMANIKSTNPKGIFSDGQESLQQTKKTFHAFLRFQRKLKVNLM